MLSMFLCLLLASVASMQQRLTDAHKKAERFKVVACLFCHHLLDSSDV